VKDREIRKEVREGYARIAKQGSCGCGPVSSCCGVPDQAQDISKQFGYTDEELAAVPAGANLGLGCGNPVALASLKEGEVVLDLGSGGGFDCFLAAAKVGPRGRAIGVDMTPEMLEKARENAAKGNYQNVEFRLGEIENLPVADNSVDAIISNCVINLSTDKERVFREAFRVLKPGGRLMVSDLVLLKELPDVIKDSVAAYVACVAGAMLKDDYLAAISAAGFQEVNIIEEKSFPVELITDDPVAQAAVEAIVKEARISPARMKEYEDSVLSINVQAVKPESKSE
jgi:SAM-dependent methyltransferase